MRVLALSNLFPSSLEPARATFNRQHFEALSERVSLSMLIPVAWPIRWRSGGPSRADKVAGQVNFQTFYYPPKLIAWHGRSMQWSIKACFARLVKEHDPDLIYATWVYPDGWAAVRLARQHRLPVVVKAHGSDLHSVERRYQALTKEVIGGADAVITVSQSQREIALELGAERNHLNQIYNGIDHKVFDILDRQTVRAELGLRIDRRLAVFIGNLKPVKGLRLLLNGFARLEQDVDLALVGAGALEQELRALCDEVGISKRVRFVGAVAHQEIPKWINAADVLLLSSRNEGVPNVLLEAKACGIPVVATDVGGIAEVVTDRQDGYLVRRRDPDELAKGIAWVLDQDWDRKQLRQRSERFSWANNAQATVDTFQAVLR